MLKHQTIHIIGYGRLGKLMFKSLKSVGYSDLNIVNKDEKLPSSSQIIIICTPDSVINKVSGQLSKSINNCKNITAVHCSGILQSDSLESLRSKGARVASFHPLMSISSESRSFQNIYFDIEGDDSVLPELEVLAQNLGAKSMRVTPVEKQLLHVSAVMASNYLLTLADMAIQVSGASNLPQRTLMDALLPLMESSLKNLKELSPTEALTGPISRGDVQTVQKHIKLLENEDELLNMYKKLGLLTLELIGKDLKDNTIKFRLYDVLK